jgi:hypothetical protein
VIRRMSIRILALIMVATSSSSLARGDERGPALANPVAGVQLEALSATRERPLFAPTRRLPPPPPPPPQATLVEQPEPPAPPPAPPELTLFGIVGPSDSARAIVRGPPSNEIRRVRIGDTIGDWVVAEIGARNLLLRLGDRSAAFQLFSSGSARPPALIAAPRPKGPPPAGLFSTPGRTPLPPRTAGRSIESDGL